MRVVKPFAIIAIIMAAACADAVPDNTLEDAGGDTTTSSVADDGGAATSPATDAAPQFSLAEFQGLRFIEGSWKGSGYAGGPFYETYRFVNDSTIEMTAWADSTFTQQQGETSQYAFRDGRVRTGEGAALLRVDAEGYHFGQPGGAQQWSFTPVTADRWTATLGTGPEPTVYTMDRAQR